MNRSKDNTALLSLPMALHYVAQVAINVTEGLNTIEAGSRAHCAMLDICEHFSSNPDLAKILETALETAEEER